MYFALVNNDKFLTTFFSSLMIFIILIIHFSRREEQFKYISTLYLFLTISFCWDFIIFLLWPFVCFSPSFATIPEKIRHEVFFFAWIFAGFMFPVIYNFIDHITKIRIYN